MTTEISTVDGAPVFRPSLYNSEAAQSYREHMSKKKSWLSRIFIKVSSFRQFKAVEESAIASSKELDAWLQKNHGPKLMHFMSPEIGRLLLSGEPTFRPRMMSVGYEVHRQLVQVSPGAYELRHDDGSPISRPLKTSVAPQQVEAKEALPELTANRVPTATITAKRG